MIVCQGQELDDDATSFSAWAERVKVDRGSFGKSSHQNKFGAWSRRFTIQSYNNNGDSAAAAEEDFRWFTKHVENDEDVLSPKLWSPTRQLAESPAVLHQLQPTSRAMEIARYRHEMMELVKDVPESAHELSLKDIVDMPTAGTLQKSVRGRTMRKKSRSKSMDVGVFTLNLFLPFSLGGKRLKRSASTSAGDSNVSPKLVKVSDKSLLSSGAGYLKLSPKSVKVSGKSSLSSGAGDSKLSPKTVKVSDKGSVSSGGKSSLSSGAGDSKLSPKTVKVSDKSSVSSGAGDLVTTVKVSDKSSVSSGAVDLKVSPKPAIVIGKISPSVVACDSKMSPRHAKLNRKGTKVRESGNQNEYEDRSSSCGSPNNRITRSESRKRTGCYSFLAKKIKTPSM